jgi:hypothetical protein
MACFFMHAMHSEGLIDRKDSTLVFSNITASARLFDLFFEKIKATIEPERALADDGVATRSTLESILSKATGADYSKFTEAIDKHELGQPEEYNKLLGEGQRYRASNPATRLLLFE